MLKQNIKSCNAKQQGQRRKTVKNSNRSNQQKKQLISTCSTLFLYISLPLFCTTTTWNFQKLLSYTFFGGNVIRALVHFSPLPLIFNLHRWPLAFLILPPLLQSFHVVLPTKKCLLCFFSRWASLACCLSLALYSKFVDMTIY